MAATTVIHALLKDRKSFLVFSLVGAATAGIYFLALAVLLEILAIDYRVAVTISYLLGVTFQFSANKFLTFKNKELMDTIPQLFRYAAVAAFNYVLTMLIVMFTVEKLRQPPYLGVFISVGVTVIVGYLLSKHWIFAQADNRK
ncbi:MAG: GtrA family protein [Burkholderiales bacterium]|nr:GtrA family protein [Burkholderiales bacterium]MBY0577376.1 GtrA family protein [Gallionellaceae bacterium]